MKYCSECGEHLTRKTPDDDHVERDVCTACGTVHYVNPKIIVGCIPVWEDRVLMCKRDIQPRLGKWTFPAGFLELNETSEAGAARETFEESRARVDIDGLVAVINVPHVSQVYLIYRGQMRSPEHGPTPESSETQLMRETEIPWDEIAFPTIWQGLKYYFADRAAGQFRIHELNLTGWAQRSKPQ